MDVGDRVAVVTGASNGIGEAIARAVHATGARAVVIADIDVTRAEAIAADLDRHRSGSALAIEVDVGSEAANAALVARVIDELGAIDLFVANAGVALGSDLETTTESAWEMAFDINVHTHRWAAKHLLPGWLERNEGYFLSTASAAGLLAQIGSGAYSVTKHAAVAFAEWLSITYGDRGIRVSCLCPQGVNTSMLNGPADAMIGGNAVRASGAVLEPADVAAVVLRALADERFLILPHPEVRDYQQRKISDIDRWLAGMRRLQSRAFADRGDR